MNQFNIRFIQYSHNSRIQILFKFPKIINCEMLEYIQVHKQSAKISWSKGIERIQSL